MIAGLFPEVDRRGPKIFWVEHHELLCALSHRFVYDRKPRPYLRERAWFYGLEGKPDKWIEANNAVRSFEEEVNETTLLALRQSVWRDEKGRSPVLIAKSEWPQSFVTNGAIEVRTDKYGVYVVVKRGPDHEGGLFLLGNQQAKNIVENDPTYRRGIFWKSGVYRYYREWEK